MTIPVYPLPAEERDARTPLTSIVDDLTRVLLAHGLPRVIGVDYARLTDVVEAFLYGGPPAHADVYAPLAALGPPGQDGGDLS